MRPVALAALAACLLGVPACMLGARRIPEMPREAAQDGYRYLAKVILPEGPIRYDCGPEALAAVLQYEGDNIPLDQVVSAIYSPERKGTHSLDLLLYARKRGYHASLDRGSLSFLKAHVDQQDPVIIMVEMTALATAIRPVVELPAQFHFFVVVGYNDNHKSVVCAGYGLSRYLVGYEDLVRAWEKTDFYALTVRKSAGKVRSTEEASTHYEAGTQHEARGDAGPALEAYTRALEADPEFALARVGIGNAWMARGDFAMAIKAYEAALDRAPALPSALNNLSWALLDSGSSGERAEALARRAVELYEVQCAEGERLGMAEEVLSRKRGEFAYSLNTLARALESRGDLRGAVKAWNRSVEQPGLLREFAAKVCLKAARALLELHDPIWAATFVEKGLDAQPGGILQDELLSLQQSLSRAGKARGTSGGEAP